MRGVEDDDAVGVEDAREAGSPAFQVIVLGAGGGPSEDNVTGLLVRSTSTNWTKSSILAVDAGTHLAAIIRILDKHLPHATREKQPDDRPQASSIETTLRSKQSLPRNGSSSRAGSPYTSTPTGYFPPVNEPKGVRTGSPAPQSIDPNHGMLILTSGPFTDLMVPYETSKANAAYLLRNLISTYLITHPHLDHLSGFAINTASFQHTSRPKKLAALPSTIDAIKTHIFNDVIWPNLSDEEGGVGLVSYMRLIEGGNVALGDGDGRGYIELCDGLAVKAWSVSHGHCLKVHTHSSGSFSNSNNNNISHPIANHSHQSQDSPSSSRRPTRNMSPSSFSSLNPHRRRSSLAYSEPYPPLVDPACVYDSSAFFIRDEHTGQEVLIFGDVEPDSLSLAPRTARIWAEAAPKIVARLLSAIFIECSYSDSQSDETLFGHLAPRHLMAELQVLAGMVGAARRGSAASMATEDGRKRKRFENGAKMRDGDDEVEALSWRKTQRRRQEETGSVSPATRTTRTMTRLEEGREGPRPVASVTAQRQQQQDASTLPHSTDVDSAEEEDSPGDEMAQRRARKEREERREEMPLRGLKVVVIHVKDTLMDGPRPDEVVIAQLREYEREVGLGCEFLISVGGESVWV